MRTRTGLLCQYLLKGTDPSFHRPGILQDVAAELRRQTRRSHGFHTPAEVLDRLLSDSTNASGGALTA